MKLKTYQGKSMAEALEKVKQELGRGAVILHTRTIRRGGLMGVGARNIVEITASGEPTPLPSPNKPAILGPRQRQDAGVGVSGVSTGGLGAAGPVGMGSIAGGAGITAGNAAGIAAGFAGVGGDGSAREVVTDHAHEYSDGRLGQWIGEHGTQRLPQYPPVALAEGAAVVHPAVAYSPELAQAATDRMNIGRAATLDQISSSTSALRSEMEELRTMVRQLIERQNTEAALAAAVRARAAANEAALAAGAGVRAGLTPSATVSSLAPSATVPSSTVTVSPVNPAVPANLGFPVAPVANPGANLAAKPVLPTNPVSPVNPVMNPVAAGSMAASPVTTMSPVASPALTLPIPEELHKYYTQLIQNAVADELAREVIARAKDRLNEWRVRLQAVGAGANKRESLDFQKLIPNALMDVIERMLPPTDPVHMVPGQGTKFVALVGPTGVGKTTTIAKLAAQFKLRERKKVALITTDTYRLAAVAQLKAYAEIMGVPIDVVYTPQELSDTMQKMQNYDVVLIDTSGRSQNDAEHLGGLQAFLTEARRTADAIAASARAAISAGAVAGAVADAKITASAKATANSKQLVGKNSKNGKNVAAGKGGKAKKIDAVASDAADATASSITAANGAQIGADGQEVVNSSYRPLETHLVLSCTSHPVQIKQILERFSRVGIDRVVFTKLDEAVGVGVILNIAHRLDVQLSYLTTGQDVPDDIEVGSRRRIAEMVLRPQKQEQAA